MGADEWVDQRIERVERRLPSWGRRAVHILRTHDVLLSASGLAFYALVSLAPLVVVVLWVTGLLLGEERVQRLAETLRSVAPEGLGAGDALEAVSEQGTRLGFGAAVAARWPATAYGSALVRGFDRLTDDHGRALPGLRGRGLAFILLPALLLGSIGASLVSTTVGEDGALSRVAGAVAALALAGLGGGVALVLVYRFFPPIRLPWKRIVLTSGVVALGTSVLSLVFSLYLALGADWEERFAMSGVAGIVMLAVWLLLVNALLLLGYRLALEDEPSRDEQASGNG
jgi:uncharacterized BrkB/YihY/UPF0761 family membrane protein